MHSSKDSNRRSSERFVISGEKSVYFRTVHGGIEFRMLVENLSMGGALLMCPAIYESIQTGECLSDGELVLSDSNSLRVNAIIRWQFWPRIGVQFDQLSWDAAAQISQLLESL